MPRSLSAVFAHPDDETFAIAGTVRRYADQGVACSLYCATDGDAGKSSDVLVGSRGELGARRRAELHAAAALLGFGHVVAAGHPDGALASSVDPDQLVAEVVAFLRHARPQVVITFAPDGGPNQHRDHRAIARAATAAFFLAGLDFAFPEQLELGRLAPHRPARLLYVSWDLPEAVQGRPRHGLPFDAAIDVRAYQPAKRAAFEEHRTQHVHRAVFESAVQPVEGFALAAGTPFPSSRDAGRAGALPDDLFAGLA